VGFLLSVRREWSRSQRVCVCSFATAIETREFAGVWRERRAVMHHACHSRLIMSFFSWLWLIYRSEWAGSGAEVSGAGGHREPGDEAQHTRAHTHTYTQFMSVTLTSHSSLSSWMCLKPKTALSKIQVLAVMLQKSHFLYLKEPLISVCVCVGTTVTPAGYGLVCREIN